MICTCTLTDWKCEACDYQASIYAQIQVAIEALEKEEEN